MAPGGGGGGLSVWKTGRELTGQCINDISFPKGARTALLMESSESDYPGK